MTSITGERGLRDVDPLDSRLAPSREPARGRPQRLGPLLASETRALILVPLGFALGPSWLRLLSPGTLSFLDPLVSVALATLGVLLGLELGTRGQGRGRVLLSAFAESALVFVLVAGGVRLLQIYGTLGLSGGVPVAVLLGLCAAASFSASMEPTEGDRRPLEQIGTMNTAMAILAAVALLIGLRYSSAAWLATVCIALPAIALAVSTAGWLLVGGTASEREQHAFVAGTLLLLGGAAAYLHQVPLFFGAVAGVVWARAEGPARERLLRDVRYVQHPLVVLLLVVAGARLEPGVQAAALALVFLFVRTSAKLAGEWLLARAHHVPQEEVPDLVASGIAGVAIAIGVAQAASGLVDGSLLLTAVALGTVATDLLRAIVRGRAEAA